MKITPRTINFKRFLFVLVAFLVVSTIQMFILTMFRKHGDLQFGKIEHHIALFVLYAISYCSTFISWNIFFSTKRNTTYSLVLVIVTSLLLNFILVFISDWFVKITTNFSEYSFYSLLNNAYTLTIMFHPYIAGFVLMYLYLKQSTKMLLELEQIEKEKTILHSQILHKNLEPHFLFNNLSVLSGLAKNRPEQIEDFIANFSEAYRYYLNHGNKQLVELKEELLFLNNYMNLMEKRFGRAYQIENAIEITDGFIIPCSLQLCVENAIKHNKANEEHPLVISLSRKNENIIIKNRLNKVDFTVGTGVGNNYLKRQYKLNFDKEVVFTETESEFVVEIPVI